jgi:hypothetical protein
MYKLDEHYELDDFLDKIIRLIKLINCYNGIIFGDLIINLFLINNKFIKNNNFNIDKDYINKFIKLDKKNLNNINNINDINIIFDNKNIVSSFTNFLISDIFKLFKFNRYYIKNDIINKFITYQFSYSNKIINLNIISNTISNKHFVNNLNLLTNNIDFNFIYYHKNNLFFFRNIFNYNNNLNNNQLTTSYLLLNNDNDEARTSPNIINNIVIAKNYTKLINRICNKTFSLVQKNYYIKNHLENINICYNLIIDGYLMDDYTLTEMYKFRKKKCKKIQSSILYDKNLLKNTIGIIFFKWSDRELLENKNLRNLYKKEDYKKILSQDECIICSNKFKDDDIVINTSCNHNFHWRTDCNLNIDCPGVSNWITNHKYNCPICRFENFI